MAIINTEKSFIMIHPPYVGGGIVIDAFRDEEGFGGRNPSMESLRALFPKIDLVERKRFPNGKVQYIPGHISRRVFDSIFVPDRRYFFSTIVRNPWERYYKLYNFLKDSPKHRFHNYINSFADFSAFVVGYTQDMQLSQSLTDLSPSWSYIASEQGLDYRFILRFENIREDIGKLSSMAGLSLSTFDIKSVPTDYRPHYSNEAKDCIESLCWREVNLFGYRFHDISYFLPPAPC
jgi:hypothetical protein